jgi:Ca2+-binding RTX toxin-like protein
VEARLPTSTRPNDTIQLENAVFTTLPLGFLNANAFWTGTAAHDSDDCIIYNQTTGALFYDSDGVGGVPQVQFATLSTKPTISNAYFEHRAKRPERRFGG